MSSCTPRNLSFKASSNGEHGPAVLHPLSGGGLEGVPSVASLSPQSKKVATEDIRYVDGVRDVCYLYSEAAEFGAK